MNISPGYTHFSSTWAHSSVDSLGRFFGHFATHLQKITPYLKSHLLTESASVMTVNFALFRLADKIFDFSSSYFDVEKNAFISPSKIGFKAVVGIAGVTGFNKLMDMQLSRQYLAASIIATFALQIIWQKLAPELDHLLAKWKQKEPKSTDSNLPTDNPPPVSPSKDSSKEPLTKPDQKVSGKAEVNLSTDQDVLTKSQQANTEEQKGTVDPQKANLGEIIEDLQENPLEDEDSLRERLKSMQEKYSKVG